MKPVIVIHHQEIVLKGNNRSYFERQLLKNVKTVLLDIKTKFTVSGGYGRFVIELESNDELKLITERLSKVFGLANICSGVKVEQNIGVFCTTSEKLLAGLSLNSIRVHTHRPDKNFSVKSMEVNAQVGAYLCDKFKVRANLTKPDETIFIEIVDGVAYVYRSKINGAGGLPVGVSGNVVALISAGFDSPVAAWQLMKRGAKVMFVHFHSLPYTSQHSVEQVKQLVGILTQYQFQSKLYLVPFADLQNQIVVNAPQSLRVILYRRMMVRIAEEIAFREKAEALVSGEAVGQVASQTLRNIRVINDVAKLPILRPLSGTDKEETMAIARNIGTYDISKEPYDDCCSFLAPRKPETWANLQQVFDSESKLEVENLVKEALDKIEIERFSYPINEKDFVADN
jgi:tRNA uracil 4-sulfurtransferase